MIPKPKSDPDGIVDASSGADIDYSGVRSQYLCTFININFKTWTGKTQRGGCWRRSVWWSRGP